MICSQEPESRGASGLQLFFFSFFSLVSSQTDFVTLA
jgi:hypothetical protein